MTGALAPYAAVIGARARMLLQYRAAAIAGVFTQIFFGLVLIMIYDAFYSSSSRTPPMTFARLATYVWLGQALFAMLPWNVDSELRAMVKSGAVGYELCRPVDLYGLWFARAVAQRTVPTALRGVPLAAFAMLALPALGLGTWRLALPGSPAVALGFLVALACALALGCAISALLNISMLWTVAGEGVVMLAATAVSLLSGLLVPLPLLPEAAQSVLRWLPFAGLFDLPFRIYNGDLPIGELTFVLARQLGWTMALVVLGRVLIRRGLRRVVVQGG